VALDQHVRELLLAVNDLHAIALESSRLAPRSRSDWRSAMSPRIVTVSWSIVM
jgi:hypothetical protein